MIETDQRAAIMTEEIVYLWQSHFDKGGVLLTKPAEYRLAENIRFRSGPATVIGRPVRPGPDSEKAAIVALSNRITINGNGYSLRVDETQDGKDLSGVVLLGPECKVVRLPYSSSFGKEFITQKDSIDRYVVSEHSHARL